MENRRYSSIKVKPIEAYLKKTEGYVYKNSMNKREKIKPNLQVNDLL